MVDPGFTISLKLPGGGDVRQLDPGTYEIVVRNLSDFHNFHLSGPGVEQSTSVGFEGNGNLDGHVPRGALPRRNAIALRTASGSHVHALKSGAYTITVRDRTAKHSFHLSGGGVKQEDGIAQVATVTWKVTLKKGTLRFFSDASATFRGSVT